MTETIKQMVKRCYRDTNLYIHFYATENGWAIFLPHTGKSWMFYDFWGAINFLMDEFKDYDPKIKGFPDEVEIKPIAETRAAVRYDFDLGKLEADLLKSLTAHAIPSVLPDRVDPSTEVIPEDDTDWGKSK